MPIEYGYKQVFALAVEHKASDIYLAPHKQPILRIKNRFTPVSGDPMTVEECNQMILDTMTEKQQHDFINDLDIDYGLAIEGIGRFRVNVFTACGAYELVARPVADNPPTIDELGLPPGIEFITKASKSGIIVVTGATGSGKTSTLAAMINYMNTHMEKKIVTIEDPIEIIHASKKSSISQRELYKDTKTFDVALRAAMRQRPDVILIGEMRDRETVNTAINASESGHLVLSTLHSINAQETIARILDFYPLDEQQQVRNLLAQTVRGIVAQKLIVDKHDKTRPLIEIMTQSLRTQEAIRDEHKTHGLNDIMKASRYENMQTFDDHLLAMISDDIIHPKQAIAYSENAEKMARELKNQGVTGI